MKQSDFAPMFPEAWGADADAQYIQFPIPASPDNTGRASLALGFPPATMTPPEAGGSYPFGADVNGALRMCSTSARNYESGVVPPYSAAYAQEIGGYPMRALVADASTNGAFWLSTADDNLTAPGASGASWVSLFQGLTPTPVAVSGSGPIALTYLYLLGSTGLLWANTFDSAGAAISKQIITADQYKTTLSGTGGYRISPDGFITQWGTATLPTSSSSTSDVITAYPIPFPSKCIGVKPVALDYANNAQGCWPSLSLYGAPGQAACHIIGDTLSHQASVSTPFDRTVAVQWVAEGF